MARTLKDTIEGWIVALVRSSATPPPPIGATPQGHMQDDRDDIHIYSNGQVGRHSGQDSETGAIDWSMEDRTTNYGDRSEDITKYDMSKIHESGENAIIQDVTRLKRVKKVWATGATNAEIASHFRGERGYGLSTIEKITAAYSAALSAQRRAEIVNVPI